MHSYTGVLGFLLCSFCAANVDLTGIPTSDQLNELTAYVQKLVKCRNVPAMAVTLVKGDSFVWSRGFGMADREKGKPATRNTRFCIGSLSKAFTSTILGKILSQQQNITWDTPVRKILGDDFRFSDELRTDIANLRDLLAHKMGVPSYFSALLNGFPDDVTRSDLVRRLQYMEATEPIRTNFLYNNYMYSLAGYVAEVLGKASWEDLVRDNIFTPLGMTSTGFINDDHGFENFALPYITVNGQLVNISKDLITSVNPAGPAGSVFSTAEDMAKWIKFHLNISAMLRSRKPHPPYLLRMADTYEGQMPGGFFPNDKIKPTYPIHDVTIAYALGWVNSNYRGYRKLWHSGGIISYTSGLWLFPDVDAGLFFSVSGPLDRNKRYVTQEVGYYAADLLLGEQSWLNMTTACNFPLPYEKPGPEKPKQPRPDQHEAHRKPVRPLADYTGIYGHLAFGNITISLGDSETAPLRLHYGRFGEMVLKAVRHPNTFVATYVGPLWYVMGADDGSDPITVKFRPHPNDKAVLSYLDYPVAEDHPTTFMRGLQLDDTTNTRPKDFCTSTASVGLLFKHSCMYIYVLFFHVIFNINRMTER